MTIATLCSCIKHDLSMDDDDDLWAVSVSKSARIGENDGAATVTVATPEQAALTVNRYECSSTAMQAVASDYYCRPLATRNDSTASIPSTSGDDNTCAKPRVAAKAAHCNPHLPQLPSATPEVVDMLVKTTLPKGEARLRSLSHILKRPLPDDRPSMAKAELTTIDVTSEKRKQKRRTLRGPIARINAGAFSGPLRRLCDYVQRKCRVRVLVGFAALCTLTYDYAIQ